jgi:hypothetical protein
MYGNTSMMELECHLHYCIYRHCFCKDYNYVKNFFAVPTSMTVSFHLAMSHPQCDVAFNVSQSSMFILSESNLSCTHGLHAYEERPNRRSYVSCA